MEGVVIGTGISEDGDIEYRDKTLLQFIHSQYDQPPADSSILALIGIKKLLSFPVCIICYPLFPMQCVRQSASFTLLFRSCILFLST